MKMITAEVVLFVVTKLYTRYGNRTNEISVEKADIAIALHFDVYIVSEI